MERGTRSTELDAGEPVSDELDRVIRLVTALHPSEGAKFMLASPEHRHDREMLALSRLVHQLFEIHERNRAQLRRTHC
jgi:hypothetical protein